MSKDIIDTNEKDFITVCFNTVAGLEVKNESQAIAKEAILDEVEYLQKIIDKAIDYIEETTKRNDELNCTKLLAVNQVEQLLEILKGKSE